MTLHALEIHDPKRVPVPHWANIPATFRGRGTIEFKPGLNIVFGENGTGKSTLLEVVARLLHCYDSNWPIVTKASVFWFNREIAADGVWLRHDGAPARFYGPQRGVHGITVGVPPEKNIKHIPVDLAPVEVRRKASRTSSTGQSNLTMLDRLLSYQPVKPNFEFRGKGDQEVKTLFTFATNQLGATEPKTKATKQQVIILDEFETALDFQKQHRVWTTIDQMVATGKYQFLISSHSPWAARYKDDEVNYIETVPGYLDRSRAALEVLFDRRSR